MSIQYIQEEVFVPDSLEIIQEANELNKNTIIKAKLQSVNKNRNGRIYDTIKS
jgi:hypothetical protein